MQKILLMLLCLIFSSLPLLAQTAAKSTSQATKRKAAEKFDPSRNARNDIQEAVAKAQKTHRRIMLDVGGEWCVWCHRLDDFFTQNGKLNQLREANFIWVKINFSPENENKELLSAYPTIIGYPHIFVLDEKGKLLHSQDTGELESGKSYSLEKMFAFLRKWSPPKPHE